MAGAGAGVKSHEIESLLSRVNKNNGNCYEISNEHAFCVALAATAMQETKDVKNSVAINIGGSGFFQVLFSKQDTFIFVDIDERALCFHKLQIDAFLLASSAKEYEEFMFKVFEKINPQGNLKHRYDKIKSETKETHYSNQALFREFQEVLRSKTIHYLNASVFHESGWEEIKKTLGKKLISYLRLTNLDGWAYGDSWRHSNINRDFARFMSNITSNSLLFHPAHKIVGAVNLSNRCYKNINEYVNNVKKYRTSTIDDFYDDPSISTGVYDPSQKTKAPGILNTYVKGLQSQYKLSLSWFDCYALNPSSKDAAAMSYEE